MSAGYVPQVGDRVRNTNWLNIKWMVVTHVSRAWVIGDCNDGVEASFPLSSPWVKVDKPEPWPEEWTVHTRMGGEITNSLSINLADAVAICNMLNLGGAGTPWPDIRIHHQSSDGSVTVLDHTGAELP